MDCSRPRRVRVKGPLQRTALRKKLINQLFFCLQPPNSQLLVRGINFAMLCCRIDAPNPTLAKGDWLLRRLCLLRYAFPHRLPRGPLQRTALRKKLINQLFFCLQPPNSQLLVRGINFAMLCCRIAPLVFPHRSPRGPLQRTALSKKLINQLFFVFGYYVCK